MVAKKSASKSPAPASPAVRGPVRKEWRLLAGTATQVEAWLARWVEARAARPPAGEPRSSDEGEGRELGLAISNLVRLAGLRIKLEECARDERANADPEKRRKESEELRQFIKDIVAAVGGDRIDCGDSPA